MYVEVIKYYLLWYRGNQVIINYKNGQWTGSDGYKKKLEHQWLYFRAHTDRFMESKYVITNRLTDRATNSATGCFINVNQMEGYSSRNDQLYW